MPDLWFTDDYCNSLFPKQGACPESPFRNGNHRVGVVRYLSLLDGGMPGDCAKEICLHCGKEFSQEWFVPIDQPQRIQPRAS